MVVVGVVVVVVVVVVVGVVGGAGSKTNPRHQKIKNRPPQTPQGNHRWRTPWWRRSQRDRSLGVFRGSGEPSSD